MYKRKNRIQNSITAYLCLSFQSLCLAETEPPRSSDQEWNQILHLIACSKKVDRRSEQAKNLYKHACKEQKWNIVSILLKHGIEMPEEAEDLGNIELNERTIIALCQQVTANSGPLDQLSAQM